MIAVMQDVSSIQSESGAYCFYSVLTIDDGMAKKSPLQLSGLRTGEVLPTINSEAISGSSVVKIPLQSKSDWALAPRRNNSQTLLKGDLNVIFIFR